MILPPVAVKAASAALSVGNKAGSGFFMSEKSFGICVRSEVIIDLQSKQVVTLVVSPQTNLDSYASTKRPSLPRGTNGSSMSGITSICADSSEACRHVNFAVL